MFNQVKVPPQDRDALRFLWWPNGDLDKPVQEYRMTTHLFGATSSPPCANFALRQTAVELEESHSSDVIEAINRNFYVDDCLKSVESSEKAIRLTEDISLALRRRGFRSGCPMIIT